MATPCGQTVMQVSSCLTRDEGVWEDLSSPNQQALLVSGRRGTLYLPVERCRAFTYVEVPVCCLEPEAGTFAIPVQEKNVRRPFCLVSSQCSF